MKLKILLIAPPHKNIVEPFRTALEKHGFAVTVAGSSPSPSRSPHTEQFALVVDLRQNGRLANGDDAIGSHLIDATFWSPSRAFPGTIQLFQNGAYWLGADGADVEKFVNTVKELFWEHHASYQHDQQRAPSNLRRASSRSAAQIPTWRDNQQPATSDQPPALIGQSPPMKKVHQRIECLSQLSNLMVLIAGETGTGKEVVARLLHSCSSRVKKPFITVNCGAIPEALFESEFFGHCKGAFTGAHVAKKGFVEAAQDGTLFMDEISTLTLSQQVKLLRLLEDHTYRRVGETEERPSNAWIIAATNQDLAEQVKKGEFREDLYHRLNVAEIILPPLRERGGDILLLAEHFLRTCLHECGAQPKKLARKSRTLLLQYHYPGNVRELKNIIEKAIIAAGPSTIIRPEHLPLPLAEASDHGAGNKKIKTLREMEREYILTVYKNCECKIKETARQLDIARNTLRERLEEYGIRL